MNSITFIKKLLIFPLKFIRPIIWARLLGVKIGNDCRLYKVTFSTEPYLVSIGDHVSATKVHFETHDGGVWVFRKDHPRWDVIRKIEIGNNVYIGYDTMILPGVKIGDNVVIAAKSVVTKSFPAGVVIGGVPARVIKSIDEYYDKIKNEVIETKGLTSREKEIFLLKHFSSI